MTLYELTEQYKELYALFDTGEIDVDTFCDTLEGLDGEIDEKIDATCAVIKNMKATVAAILSESENLAERAKSKQAECDRLCERLKVLMQKVGRDRYESSRHSVKFNKGERLVFTDEAALFEYLKAKYPEMVTETVVVKVNRNEVKKAIKCGEEIPHTEFIQTISISVK